MKHTPSITLIMIASFLLAQFVGLAIINQYIDVQKTKDRGEVVFEELPYGIERPSVEEQTSFIYIMSAVLIGTLLLFVLIRFRARLLWKIWYFTAIFIALIIAFNAFIPSTAAAVIGFGVALWRLLKPNVILNNFSEIFIYGGLAAIFVPIMNVFAVIMLLILISAYDAYAVWKSKHMIKLAKFQSENNMFAGLHIPYKPGRKPDTKGVSRVAVLGGGDIAFPLIFAGVVFKSAGWAAAVIPITTAIALALLLYKGEKGKFYPAMPFLTAGCLAGYLILMVV